MSRVLVFAGSIREGSSNKKLARAAAEALEGAGVTTTLIDLADFEMPLYNGDLEAESGLPESTLRLKELFAQHQGLVISCPEYNSSITPLLKNTIDWLSRAAEGEAPLSAFRGKVAGLLGASPGALGGLRGLVHVRSILGNIGVWVAPTQVALGKAHAAFDDEGKLTDESAAKRLGLLATELREALVIRAGDGPL